MPLSLARPVVLSWVCVFTLLSLTVSLTGCGVVVRGVYEGITALSNSALFHSGRHGQLTAQEQIWAKVAWRYFTNNYNPQTGLVNSVDRYTTTTMWHVADVLAALIAAQELELIDRREFDVRLSRLLHFLNTMPLSFGRLPNKVYNASTGAMVNYGNQPEEIGWSAIDLGRLLIWLRITAERYPEFSEYIDKAVLRWNFCDVLDRCGTLYGGVKIRDNLQLYQEGRLGYEEYAAMGYQSWGFDTAKASSLAPYQAVKIYDIEILHDGRDPRQTGTPAPVLSLPYILHGLEFHWEPIADTPSVDRSPTSPKIADLADRIYRVQEARYVREKIFTARTDHQISRPPFFVYDSIFAAGYAWNTIADSGAHHPEFAMVATRAVFGLWVLWRTAYTDQLLAVVHTLFDPERGWYEGRYEQTGGYDETITCTTNALILEALLYKVRGQLFRAAHQKHYLQIRLEDMFRWPGRCFPPEREQCE